MLCQPLIILEALLLQVLQKLISLAAVVLVAEVGQVHGHCSLPEAELVGQSVETADYLNRGGVVVVYLEVLVRGDRSQAGAVAAD